MSDYTPDHWLVVKITTDKERLYKVFATWSGGYGGSDSWKMNSGIVRANFVNDHWEFDGHSGSVYQCHYSSYGTNGYGGNVLQTFIDQAKLVGTKIEVMPVTTDWASLDYDALQQFIANGVTK